MPIDFQPTGGGSAPGQGVPPEYRGKKLLHICEVCGRRELLTPEEGFDAGWDYAPYLYPFGLLSPRTCPHCAIDQTAWWAITVQKKRFEELTEAQQETVLRIHGEPESILPGGEG